LLLGFEQGRLFSLPPGEQAKPVDGERVGEVEFRNEGLVEMDRPFGNELDGRLYTSLSEMDEHHLVTRAERFYLRTRASQLLPQSETWSVAVDGLVESAHRFKIDDLQASAKPLGAHLLECAGNTRAAHFGMISVGEWAGVPVSELLSAVKRKASATQILVNGFDRYVGNSVTSTPGASWIFKVDELLKANAFLATKLNGSRLSRDHGAPVRLLVPGWYGCTCIKWVDRISLVNDARESTSQMLEYATRTHQDGTPRLAMDFRPAFIDHAAMPIRVEKWQVGNTLKYRVVGLLWGGSPSALGPVKTLGIRFNPEEDYVPVDHLPASQSGPWTLWSHEWRPSAPGIYTIRLAIKDPEWHPKRLESGYYARSVEITEI
jgi:DMSO/TMAO reductase YedYZ molybdopterin-dependent catalytic subunit